MIRYFLIFLLCPVTIYSQFTENWNRNNLTDTPEWIGETDKFQIISDSYRLYLNAPEESSSAVIFTSSSAIENAEWNFSVSMEFNPSSSNYCVVYLCCNQCEINENLEGYFVKIGDTSDNVSLWKTSGGVDTKLINGTEKILDLSNFKLDIKVLRNDKGKWELYTDLNNSELVKEGEVEDSEIYQSNYFGIYCKYTKTRRDKFYFGPISVLGDPYTDKTPPSIISHDLNKGEKLELLMSELINIETSNYDNIKINGHAADINRMNIEGSLIEIDFKDKIDNAERGTIEVSGFKDLNGNSINDTILYYSYFKPERYDIVFSEIMVDPSPTVGLPDCEFIEIYNQTDHDINLDQYKIVVNDKSSTLPDFQLCANQYAIIVSDAKSELFDEINVVSVSSFPSLSNSKGTVVLVDNENHITDAIRYPFSDISESFKKDGGWSFEKMDLGNQDLSSYNWDYSLDLDGGSPGLENSNKMDNNDSSKPIVNYLSYLNESSFKIYFSEAIDSSIISNSYIKVDQHSISQIELDTVFLKEAKVILNEELNSKEEVNVNIESDICDLNNNRLSNDFDWRIGIPEKIDSLDLCLNEILFNPQSDGVDFIEIYNRSDKIINVDDVYLANVDDGIPIKLYTLNSSHQLILPGEYWVVSEDTSSLEIQYDIVKQHVIESDLPSLNDEEGNVAIVTSNGLVIDYLEYNEEMHYELLNNQEGVSLERLNVYSPTNDPNNWHSASTEVGYATPTYVNSQVYDVNSPTNNNWIWLDEETFSPNSDGEKDYLVINYKMPDVGYSGTVKVYDKNGIPIKNLSDNSLFSAEGFIQWDGVQSNHIKAPMGIYIIFAEVFSPKGDVMQEKLVCVVTGGIRK